MELIMEQHTNYYEKYKKAQKQVREIKGFYTHLFIYSIVMIGLVYINLRFSPQYLWFIWSMSGWGIGLIFHGMKAYNYTPFLGKNWEEQKIKEYMEKEKNKKKYE